jgi:hypothetical protein
VIAPNITLTPRETAGPTHASRLVWQHRYRVFSHSIAALGILTSGVTLIILPTLLSGGLFVVQVLGTLTLRRAAKTIHPIEHWGRVRDLTTGTPLSGAVVRLYTVDQHKLVDTQITDAAGRYAFFVGPNTYSIQSEKTGYFSAEKTLTVAPRDAGAVITEILTLSSVETPTFDLRIS